MKVTRDRLSADLRAAEPAIRLGRVSGSGDGRVLISVFTLQESEVKIVAERMRGLLHKAVR